MSAYSAALGARGPTIQRGARPRVRRDLGRVEPPTKLVSRSGRRVAALTVGGLLLSLLGLIVG